MTSSVARENRDRSVVEAAKHRRLREPHIAPITALVERIRKHTSVGTALLQAELARQGFEVAKPVFDRGIDLIAFSSARDGEFRAPPIQVKAASTESFVVQKKYRKIGGLILAYVWGVESKPRFFLMTYDEAVALLGDAAQTRSWKEMGVYSWTRRVDADRKRQLNEFENRWDWLREKLSRPSSDVGAGA